MSDIKVGSVVQIRDMSGFSERTVRRFNGKCCKVESLTPGMAGYNANVRIIGCEDEPFNSITVRVSRLVYIHQVPKGTTPKPTAPRKMVAPFGPVPVDDWSYNSTTLEGLARGEVAELRSTISDATTRLCGFTHIRKADVGCWVRINPGVAHYVASYLSARGVFANPVNLGWVFLRYGSKAFKNAAFLSNGNVVYITAFEYPAMRSDLEASLSRKYTR